MTRVTHFCHLLLALRLCLIQAQIRHESGWTPIPNAEIFRRLNLNIPKPNIMPLQRMDIGWNPTPDVGRDGDRMTRNDVIKVVTSQRYLGDFTSKSIEELQESNKKKELKDIKSKEHEKNNEITNKPYQSLTEANTRKARKLNGGMTTTKRDYIDNSIEEKVIKENIVKQPQDSDKITIEGDESQSYEVTENSATVDFFKAIPNNIKATSGYVYEPPPRIGQNQNNFDLTKTFKDILAKYKINSKDELTNYAKSRTATKHQQINPQIIYLPVPSNLPNRLNNHNHMPVDPLVAVFLSNYGYYLPNSYGLHNNYKNLYGYLASNNIHNNKPFGLYKIFSDTDSSSK